MEVDIYVREKSGKRAIRFPLLPESFEFSSGNVQFISTDIIGLGEVAEPSGTDLGQYKWESEFPGALRQNDPMIRGQWQHPDNYVNTIQEWQRNGELLNILITGYPVNVDVYVKEFTPKGAGAFGDVSYKIVFAEARTISITKMSADGTTQTKRIAYRSKQYTILYGDTLWAISQKFYGSGSKWKDIYEANKEIIESQAKNHGKQSSENGRWIYPGTIITIP